MSTDDAMRLVEVRDLIGGQGWFDLFQYRLDPPRHVDALVAAHRRAFGRVDPVAEAAVGNARRRSRDAVFLAGAALCRCAGADRGDRQAIEPAILTRDGGGAAGGAFASGPRPFPARRDRSPQRADRFAARTGPDDGADRAERRQGRARRPDGIAVAGHRRRNAARHRGDRSLRSSAFLSGAAPPSRGRSAPSERGWRHRRSCSQRLCFHCLRFTVQVCDAFGGPVLLLTAGGGISLMVMVGMIAITRHCACASVSGAAAGDRSGRRVPAVVSRMHRLALRASRSDPRIAVDQQCRRGDVIRQDAAAFPEKVPGFYALPIMTLGFAVDGPDPLPSVGKISLDCRHRSAGAADRSEPLAGAGRRRRIDGGGSDVCRSLAILWPGLAAARTCFSWQSLRPRSALRARLSAKPLTDAIFKPERSRAIPRPAGPCRTSLP